MEATGDKITSYSQSMKAGGSFLLYKQWSDTVLYVNKDQYIFSECDIKVVLREHYFILIYHYSHGITSWEDKSKRNGQKSCFYSRLHIFYILVLRILSCKQLISLKTKEKYCECHVECYSPFLCRGFEGRGPCWHRHRTASWIDLSITFWARDSFHWKQAHQQHDAQLHSFSQIIYIIFPNSPSSK